jgi:hypothetical protein
VGRKFVLLKVERKKNVGGRTTGEGPVFMLRWRLGHWRGQKPSTQVRDGSIKKVVPRRIHGREESLLKHVEGSQEWGYVMGSRREEKDW